MHSNLRIPLISQGWRMGLIALTCLAPVLCLGELQWKTKHLDLTTKPGDRDITAAFPFKNTGSTPVTIVQIQPSCGCTTANLSKRTYAPGESGVIQAVFNFGDRGGLQEKLVEVVTDEPSSRPVALTFRLTIPERITCDPRLLVWTKGGKPTEQSTIITATDAALKITSVETFGPTLESFTHRIETVEPGKKYRLFVRPNDVAGVLDGSLNVQARFDDGTVQTFVVYALVK